MTARKFEGRPISKQLLAVGGAGEIEIELDEKLPTFDDLVRVSFEAKVVKLGGKPEKGKRSVARLVTIDVDEESIEFEIIGRAEPPPQLPGTEEPEEPA